MSAKQIPRRQTHARKLAEPNWRGFDYHLPYHELDLRKHPELYRVGRSEQGVLLVEPYKSEILPSWAFATPKKAKRSAREILRLFHKYSAAEDFVGMDMARKFLQMGYTRSRRYANHASGRKYSPTGELLPFRNDAVKAQSAEIFRTAWFKAEADLVYQDMKAHWRCAFG